MAELTKKQTKALYMHLNTVLAAFDAVVTSGAWDKAKEDKPAFCQTFERAKLSAQTFVDTLPEVQTLEDK